MGGSIKAIIMAGGEGTRLRPLTVTRPKPMVPLVNKPMMEHVVLLLRRHGIREIGVTLHYLPETIMSYFGNGGKWGVEITYSIEEKPLGTAGGVRKLYDEWGDESTIVVISGDVFTDIDLTGLIEFHRRKGSVFTMAVRRVSDPTRYGIALLDEDGRVRRFLEKPRWSEVFSDIINMGIYVIEPEALKLIPAGREYDFSKNLIPAMLEKDYPVYGWRADNYYWSDIGNHQQYKETHWDILSGKTSLSREVLGEEVEPGIYVQGDAVIEDPSSIAPPAVIGSDARIVKGATLGPYAVIGRNSIVEHSSRIEKSILWNHVYVGPYTSIADSILGDKVRLEGHIAVMEGSVIGDETVIGRGSIIKPGIRIWPSKIIDPYTVVSANIKWGIRWYKTLIEPWGITGLINIELTPELASRIGLAIGSWIRKGGRVAIARDTFSTSRLIKHSLVAGLLAAGVNVDDLRVAPLPVLTHYITVNKLDGGIMVSTLAFDPQRVRIKIFGREGLFVSKADAKSIESIFFKEAYRRVLADEVGSIAIPSGFMKTYIRALVENLDVESIRRAGRAIFDCGYGSTGSILPSIVDALRVNYILVNCRELTPVNPPVKPFIQDNIDCLSKTVVSLGLSAGFIFDSDGDKIVVVDDAGRVISGDRLIALMARIVLETVGKGVVVAPVSSSRIIDRVVEEYGGRVVRTGIGLRSIVDALIKYNAVMAVDERGAIVYPWLHKGPDAFYTALKIMEYIGMRREPLSRIVMEIPEPAMLKTKIIVPYGMRGVFMRRLYEELREKEIEALEGIRVVEENLGWAYIHPLPNEPSIEIIAEGDTVERAEKLAKMLIDIAENIKKKVSS